MPARLRSLRNEDYRTSLTSSRSFGTRLLWKVLNFVDMASLFITISQVLRNQELRTFFLLLSITVNYFICRYFQSCKFWSRGFWNSFLFHFQTWYTYTVKFDMMTHEKVVLLQFLIQKIENSFIELELEVWVHYWIKVYDILKL